ncbi:extracellular solute-binding protein [Synechocystis sp. PCC 6803]|uniref:Extracellular solute-binding protein n=1 Tax=Synechocystis sp. (strain ATCC 27184 / PCC 6803 / Kazusa) TaxID=1111708 RepID=P73732_SYNY3|nr:MULTISPECIES: peptide ABC transporter substrate-binding protein [unclassified Synechocystis]MBD2617474.1 peptide ABC transporter substrate-binding protein [Synechocystis sp. FACHB-898]MBD2638833.1 peptide ABC transporter substrate-binding protein [Synechocystis sp. FACHB-908]MBD2660080.1 peptide ABC transporter substrate-binding protein [Synechocystis sp. FACHB-929]AGF51468.1 extracellular solute-binding protein [Synechocystis sp. PCC 6803]ALJ67472.1 peptide ABC transporter substrate-bindin
MLLNLPATVKSRSCQKLIGGLLPLLLFACGSPNVGNGNSQQNGQETLKILSWQAPTILNPHLATGFKDAEASRIALEPLASFDQEGNLVPFLAAEIPSVENGGVAADGLSVTWKLKPDVLWSDGQPFSAEDVAFTYKFLSDPKTGATSTGTYEAIAKVEALDKNTVKITFKEPNPAWFLPFVGSEGMILPQHIYKDFVGEKARQAPANLLPIGTGPYRVTSFKPGDVVLYEVNPHYRDRKNIGFQQVEIKGGGDATSAARAVLQTGDADFALNLQVEDNILQSLAQGGKGEIVADLGSLSERVIFNLSDPDPARTNGDRSSVKFPHPFLQDPLVRKAITLGIDRDLIAKQLYGVTGQPTANVLVLPQQYASQNTSFQFNPTEAQQLLDQAGWKDSNGNGIRDKDGIELQMVFQTSVNPLRQKTQQVIKQTLQAIGVGVELKSIDPSVFFSGDPANPDTLERFQGDLSMFTTGNTNPDPSKYMQTFTCGAIPTAENQWSGDNYGRYCSAEYDQLWQKAVAELDPEKRQQLFIQMNDLLVDDYILVPVVHRASVVGVGDRLDGVALTPWDRPTWNIKDWQPKAK